MKSGPYLILVTILLQGTPSDPEKEQIPLRKGGVYFWEKLRIFDREKFATSLTQNHPQLILFSKCGLVRFHQIRFKCTSRFLSVDRKIAERCCQYYWKIGLEGIVKGVSCSRDFLIQDFPWADHCALPSEGPITHNARPSEWPLAANAKQTWR